MLTVDTKSPQTETGDRRQGMLNRGDVGLANRTLRERVHQRLRDEILANELLPGTELQEVALTKILGVSRGPIREALHRLGAEGLVTIRPRRGAVVSSLSKAAFLDAYQIREALETLAVRLATPKFTDEEIKHLSDLNRVMRTQAEGGDVAAFFETNAAFHAVFVDLSGNQRLRQMHRRLVGEMSRYRGMSLTLRGSLRGSIKEHREVIGAVTVHDVERAVGLMSQHIRVPQRRLESMAAEDVLALALSRDPASALARASGTQGRPEGDASED